MPCNTCLTVRVVHLDADTPSSPQEAFMIVMYMFTMMFTNPAYFWILVHPRHTTPTTSDLCAGGAPTFRCQIEL